MPERDDVLIVVREWMQKVEAAVGPELSDEELARFTDYSTAGRYPGWGPIPLITALAWGVG